jgi:hypothetical protein
MRLERSESSFGGSRQNRVRYVFGALLSIVCALEAPPTRAQDAVMTSSVPEFTLKHHRFLNPTYVVTPFVSTNVRFEQGFYLFSIPDFPVTQRRNYDVSAAGITEKIAVGIRFLDRFQVFGMARVQLLAGTNAKSVILSGTTYTYSMGGGLAARLIRSEDTGTQLTLRAQVTTGPLGQLDLLAFANNLIDRKITAVDDIFNLRVAESSLATGTESVFRAHAVAAQSLGRYFGIQGFVGLSGFWDSVTVFDPTDDQDKTTHADSFSAEGGLSIDLTLLPVPLGFNLEYALEAYRRDFSDSEGASSTQLVHTLAAGIFVIDERFQAGLSIGTALGLDPIERTLPLGMHAASGTPTTLYGQLQIQYLW